MQTPARRPRLEQHRARIDDVRQASAQETWVTGRVLVEGVGESLVSIVFPVTFSGRPLPILGGGELEAIPNRSYFPEVNAVVVGWESTDSGVGEYSEYVTGADLAILVSGREDQRIWVTFAFVGVALMNPTEVARGASHPGSER